MTDYLLDANAFIQAKNLRYDFDLIDPVISRVRYLRRTAWISADDPESDMQT